MLRAIVPDIAPISWAISEHPVEYLDAVSFMATRAEDIRRGKAGELIWLLEHPALYTEGTSAKSSDLLSPNILPVFQSGRGGQYTYHGPGQRVVYVMLDLKQRGNDIRALIKHLEAWIIDSLDAFNVKGLTRQGRVGIWVQRPTRDGVREDKIAALGLRVTGGVTTHGLSINVEPDLSHYQGIIPCGLHGFGVTSLTDLGLPVSMNDLDVALRRNFEKQFGPVSRTTTPTGAA